jgi:hypothetical protein
LYHSCWRLSTIYFLGLFRAMLSQNNLNSPEEYF